ncbi:hypothetical protein BD770DRAFT_414187 [Pilaira anomala]|nr:hypothetical protein BD770DRAFT_414187 [Pilaira anomala]
MTSIFKAIRNNDIQLLNYFIQHATGDHGTIPKQDLQFIQQHQHKLNNASKHFDLNKRSVNGRTALHVAVTWNRVQIAHDLIHCSSVNINLRDRENGWTALHRALYMGNIEIARMLLSREDIDLSIKDWEGLDAFELYNTTIPNTYPKHQIQLNNPSTTDLDDTTEQTDEPWQTMLQPTTTEEKKLTTSKSAGGTDLYTWGHNTNYVLGHADSENRQRPERVPLSLSSQHSPCIMTRPNGVTIESIAMSKYHMAILTSEPQLNLLLCGFGRGGRLGTGKEHDTQFTLVPLPWPERIVSMALGRDHTIAITASGSVLTFGLNKFGQLGYDDPTTDPLLLHNNNPPTPMQLVPKKIQAQSLKKQPILGAAASRIHSVVYTATDLFTFGYNQGQLGYYQPDQNKPCQTSPRKVSSIMIMSRKILQVVANDHATVILNDAHDIILLCNYNQQKLFLPVRRFPNHIQIHRSELNFAVKLLGSGTEYLGAVTNAGDVFVWSCRSSHPTHLDQQQHNTTTSTGSAGGAGGGGHHKKGIDNNRSKTIVSTPKRIWAAHQPHLAAIDASLGQNGELIICTVSGHVLIGRSESNGYKFHQVPTIQRCVQVCANSSGAFAAIRSEYQLNPITDLPPSTLSHDLYSALPHVSVSDWVKNEFKRHALNQKFDMKRALERFSKYNSHHVVASEDMHGYDVELNTIRENYDALRAASIDEAWVRADSLGQVDPTLDIVLVVEGRNIYCHSSILRCRSEVFKQLVKSKDKSLGGDIKIHLHKRVSSSSDATTTTTRIEIQIQHCQLSSVLLLLEFIYTDQYAHPMTLAFQVPILASFSSSKGNHHHHHHHHTCNPKSIQKDLIALAKIFYIPNLITTAQENYYRKTTSLERDLKYLLEKKKGTDIVVRTKDGTVIKCHEIVLRQRCPFFGNILKPGSVWVQNRRENPHAIVVEGHIEVNLEHVSTEIMDTILKYIYMDDNHASLFDSIEKDREESMMYFLLNLLCESDALLLTRLKAITESALLRFVKLRSATVIFEYADIYLAESLKKSCLEFISVNLPTFLSSSMLDSISTELIHDLENYVRQAQIEETPTVPRGQFSFTKDDSYLEEVEDPEFSTSLYASSRGDGSVSSFLETLVTLRHEKPPTPKQQQQQQSVVEPVRIKSPVLTDQLTLASSSSSKNEGKMKKGVKVSFENLENELNSLETQPRRKSSTGWATTAAVPEEMTESSIKPSLREILEQENQPHGSGSKTIKSSVPKKISQKERRKLIQKQEVSESSTSAGSSKSVWGKVASVDPIPIAMDTVEVLDQDKKGKKIYVTEDLLDELQESSSNSSRNVNTISQQIKFNAIESFGPSFQMTPIRRLHFDSSTSSKDTKKSFQTIQKQQLLEDNWRKNFNPKKNITKIQKEEQAIEAIAQYQIQTLDIMSGEWFEVRRMTS